MSQNVVILSFAEPSAAHRALAALQQAGEDKHLEVHYAAVAQRNAQGEFKIQEGTHDEGSAAQPAAATVVGSVVGMLAGPVGVVLGAASGAILGSAWSESKVYDRLDVLEEVGIVVPRGGTALIAVLEETHGQWVQELAHSLGATVERRPLEDVEARVAARGKAQFEAAKEALKNNQEVK